MNINFGKTYKPQSETIREREIMDKRTGRMDFVDGYKVFSCKEKGWRAEVTINGNRTSAINCMSRRDAIDGLIKLLKEEETGRTYYRLENRITGEIRYDWASVYSMGFDDTKWIQTEISRKEYFEKVSA